MIYTAYVDEVGCSAIASSVVTCCVVLDSNIEKIAGVKDSKQLTKLKREKLYGELCKLPHAFGAASPRKIEKLNIFWARFLAMKEAVEKMSKLFKIDKVIVDGNYKIPNLELEQQAIVKADEKYWQVGAASILAKVKRDSVMAELAKIEKYSYYDWQNNAAYYTERHRDGIILHGPTTLHRRNFSYFKYCLFCHKKCQEFLNDGKTFEDYKEWMKINGNGKSDFAAWKEGAYDSWKEIPYGVK